MKISKLLALMMALVMAVCVFSACGNDKKADVGSDKNIKKEVIEISDEDAVKAAMEKFSDLYFSGNEEALGCVSAEAQGYEDIKAGIEEIASVKEKFEGMAESFGLSEEYNNDIKEIATEFMDGVFAKMSITVKDVVVDGNKAVATCTFESPDFDNMDNIIDDELVDEALKSAFTEEELMAIDSEDEKAQAEMSLKLIDTLFDMVVLQLEPVAEDIEYNLEKISGDWIIVGKY